MAENTAVPKVDQSLQGWEVLRYRQWKKSRKFILQINFWHVSPKKWFRFVLFPGGYQLTYPMCLFGFWTIWKRGLDLLKSDLLKNPWGNSSRSNSQGPPHFFPWLGLSVGVYMGVSTKIGGKPPPKWMVKIMENPIKMDDFRGTTIFGNPPYIIFSFFGGIILPNYIGITINHYKDPY